MVLMPIVFISVLIGILQYIRLLPIVIRGIGTVLARINGMGKLESFNAISSMIVGQSENFIAYKNIIHTFDEKRMYTLAATAMSTVSMSIVGSYMQMIEPRYVLSVGACACTGGFYDCYCTVPGIDEIIPVDVYIAGCPPRPEAYLEAIMQLQSKIMDESYVKARATRNHERIHIG
jgi:hypothetical protein